MSDEVVDTQQTPAESVEPLEPTEEMTDNEVQEPAYITTEQLQEELKKQDQSFRSWLGRRDKETLSHIGNVINDRLSQRQETPDEVSTRLLENPREVIRSEFQAYQNEMTEKQTTHLNTTMETVGQLMESDPLYTDKNLGNEVVTEIKKMVQTGKVDHDLPPGQAGKVILGDALSNVIRTRQNAKTNPLASNTAQNTTTGLQPPAKPTAKIKVPKLDNMTKTMAEKWGYSEEDLAKLYGE
ncbi:MAG: hypothetical protein ACYSU8_06405 [Planctomycetota bacterium]|jgi:exonuclease VII large subunit